MFTMLTIDHHVVSNDSGGVESSLSGACCWETGAQGCPKPPVYMEHVGVVDSHTKPGIETHQKNFYYVKKRFTFFI